jgi:hypothetical protein
VREQYFMLLIESEASVAAIPDLLPAEDVRRRTLATIRQVLSARGEITGEVAERLRRVARLLCVEEERATVATVVAEKNEMAKAS